METLKTPLSIKVILVHTDYIWFAFDSLYWHYYLQRIVIYRFFWK